MWGWHMLGLFVTANLVTFACYSALGLLHLRTRAADPLMHRLYGAFIAFCGLGHLTMAVHMTIYPSPALMTTTHLATAVVSAWTVFASQRRTGS